MKPISYARHRFPPDVIRHAVWLYLRFTLSYRDVEDLLAERGFDVSNESIRRWVLKFGPAIARNLRSIRPRPHDQWGIWTIWWSRLAVGECICGALSTAKARFSRSWFSPDATRLRHYGCSGNCFDVRASFRRLSSPTNSDPTEQRFATLASRDCTSTDCAPTIERRTRISSFDDARERCKASNQASRLSASFPSMRSFTMRSMCSVT